MLSTDLVLDDRGIKKKNQAQEGANPQLLHTEVNDFIATNQSTFVHFTMCTSSTMHKWVNPEHVSIFKTLVIFWNKQMAEEDNFNI